jgi:hypothetical protein
MRRPLLIAAITIAIASAALLFAKPGQAADLNVNNSRHVSRSDCGPSGCRWHRRRCPDQLSCYPLYGAYGPYGGEAYWGAYAYAHGYDYR